MATRIEKKLNSVEQQYGIKIPGFVKDLILLAERIRAFVAKLSLFSSDNKTTQTTPSMSSYSVIPEKTNSVPTWEELGDAVGIKLSDPKDGTVSNDERKESEELFIASSSSNSTTSLPEKIIINPTFQNDDLDELMTSFTESLQEEVKVVTTAERIDGLLIILNNPNRDTNWKAGILGFEKSPFAKDYILQKERIAEWDWMKDLHDINEINMASAALKKYLESDANNDEDKALAYAIQMQLLLSASPI